MSKEKNSTGFTIIELLITTSLIALMGLVIYTVFSKGMMVWERGQIMGSGERDARFTLEKMASELRNSFDFYGVNLSGNKTQISFASYVNKAGLAETPVWEPGRLTYFFDPSNKALMRIRENYVDTFNVTRPAPDKAVAPISSFEIGYYCYSPDKKEHVWKDSWENKGGLPLGVRMNLTLALGGEERSFVKTVYFP